MTVHLIAAIGRRGQIGRNGDLPWPRNASDMAHFRGSTMGGVVIMGERTYRTVGALDGRKACNWNGERPSGYLKNIRRLYREWPIWIAGGAMTYRAFAPFVDGLKLISLIDYDNDRALDHEHVFFPFDAFGMKDLRQ